WAPPPRLSAAAPVAAPRPTAPRREQIAHPPATPGCPAGPPPTPHPPPPSHSPQPPPPPPPPPAPDPPPPPPPPHPPSPPSSPPPSSRPEPPSSPPPSAPPLGSGAGSSSPIPTSASPCKNVVFPLPLGPRPPTRSPGPSCQLTSSNNPRPPALADRSKTSTTVFPSRAVASRTSSTPLRAAGSLAMSALAASMRNRGLLVRAG